MKDADMIRAVAEFEGRYQWDDNGTGEHWHDSQCGMDVIKFDELPPYLSSLDAIVPVTEKLRDGQRYLFMYNLKAPSFWHMTNATARQRCEALLRTIGKWSAIERANEKEQT